MIRYKALIATILISASFPIYVNAASFEDMSETELEEDVSRLGHFIGNGKNIRRHEASVAHCMLQTEVWDQKDGGAESLWTIFEMDLRGLTIPEPDEKTGLRTLFADTKDENSFVFMPITVTAPFELRHEKAAHRAKPGPHRVENASSRDSQPYVYEYRQDGFILFMGATQPDQFEDLFKALNELKTRFCATTS